MSVTGLWIVGAVPDSTLTRLLQASPRLPAVSCLAPNLPADLTWWKEKSSGEQFLQRGGPHGLAPTPSALRFSDFVESSRASFDAVVQMKDATMALYPPEEGADLFCASARKADPVAALAYAIGAAATLQLPGWFGDFTLTSQQVIAALPKVEHVLALTADERTTVVGRIRDWMTAMGDEPDFDADGLLDGPLRVMRAAAQSGRAVAAQTRSY